MRFSGDTPGMMVLGKTVIESLLYDDSLTGRKSTPGLGISSPWLSGDFGSLLAAFLTGLAAMVKLPMRLFLPQKGYLFL